MRSARVFICRGASFRKGEITAQDSITYIFMILRRWVIPYHFTKLLHMTPSELNKKWCVGSPSSLMYPKRVSLNLLVWLPRNTLLNTFLFCSFAMHIFIQSIITWTFCFFEKWFAPLQS